MPPSVPNFREIIAALNEEKVDFVVIGGLALILQGGSHVTEDCDIAVAVDPANKTAIVRALSRFYPVPTGFKVGDEFDWSPIALEAESLHLETSVGRIDILTVTPGVPDYAALRTSANKKSIYGFEFLVACIDDLIATKSAAGRTKDKLHLLELRDLRRIEREENR